MLTEGIKENKQSHLQLYQGKRNTRENGPSINEEGGEINVSCKMSELLNCCFQVRLYEEIGVWIIRK